MPKNNFLNELLSFNNKISSMRLSVLSIVFCFSILLISLSIYVIYNTFTGSFIDWSGISYFLAGSSAPILAVLGSKAYQKGKE